MGALVRVLLLAAVGFLAAGTQVVPHEHVPGWSHRDLDHPAGAVHATLLEHVRYLLQHDVEDAAAASSGTSFAPAPSAVAAAAAIVLALFSFPTSRMWRPSRLGIARLESRVAAAQLAVAPAHAPPRASFSS